MITASKLAGFFAAHAIWCVHDGDTLIPMLAYSTEDGQRQMDRLLHDETEAAVTIGKQMLQSNEMGATDAALLFDGYITIGEDRMDAILIEFRTYFSPDSLAVLAVPYTSKDAGRFLVHKPKLLAWDNCEDFNLDEVIAEFFDGVGEHEQGAAIWDECLDESK